MTLTNIGKTTVSNMTNNVSDYSVDLKSLDSPLDQDETTYLNTKWTQYLGYYKTIPEIKSSIDAIARWTIGRGFTADPRTTVILNHITGYGEDTFDTILKNMIVTAQINGDAFAEVIKDKETGILVNLKPLNAGSIQIVVDRKGIIKRYEQIDRIRKLKREFKPEDIFHLVNNRIGDEIHGVSIVEAVEKIILMRNEALNDYQKVLHRNVYPFKIWHLDTDDQTKINDFISKVEKTVNDKENIFIPKGNVEVEIPSISANSSLNPLPWIQYLGSFFFQAVGIPQIILGGSQEFTEATAKIAYLSFQQTVEDHQRNIESQLWAQLALRINLEFPASLENELLSDQKKDVGQTTFQPNETTAGIGA